MARPKRPAPFVAGGAIGAGIGNTPGPDSGLGGGSNLNADGTLTIDPASLTDVGGSNGAADGSATIERKRRGRKPGSTNARKTQDTVSVEGLSSILFSAHTMLAAITRTQEFLIDPDEAALIAKASAEVMAYYDTLKISGQAVAWFGLVSALGAVYGPRVIAYRMRNAAPKSERPAAPQPSTAQDRSRPQETIKTANGGKPAGNTPQMVEVPGFGMVTVGEKPH